MGTKLRDNIRNLLDLNAPIEPELKPLSPTGGPLTPEPRPKYHGDTCNCASCLDIRAAMHNYLTAKKAFEQNGF